MKKNIQINTSQSVKKGFEIQSTSYPYSYGHINTRTPYRSHLGSRSKIVERSQEAIQVKNSGKEFQNSSFVSNFNSHATSWRSRSLNDKTYYINHIMGVFRRILTSKRRQSRKMNNITQRKTHHQRRFDVRVLWRTLINMI